VDVSNEDARVQASARSVDKLILYSNQELPLEVYCENSIEIACGIRLGGFDYKFLSQEKNFLPSTGCVHPQRKNSFNTQRK
jgi:hypothetical protein